MGLSKDPISVPTSRPGVISSTFTSVAPITYGTQPKGTPSLEEQIYCFEKAAADPYKDK